MVSSKVSYFWGFLFLRFLFLGFLTFLGWFLILGVLISGSFGLILLAHSLGSYFRFILWGVIKERVEGGREDLGRV